MLHLLLNWIVSAVSLLLVAQLVRGVSVQGFGTAMIAAAVIAVVNSTLGLLLASALVPGFRMQGFGAAFVGTILLSLLQSILRWLLL